MTKPRQLTTDLQVEGEQYRLHKLTARDSSWILSILMVKAFPGPELPFTGMATGKAQASKEEFEAIQGLCLASCARYPLEGAAPVPIFALPNTWLFPELEYDLDTVMNLTVAQLVFNLSGFFAQGGLSALLKSLRHLNPQILAA